MKPKIVHNSQIKNLASGVFLFIPWNHCWYYFWAKARVLMDAKLLAFWQGFFWSVTQSLWPKETWTHRVHLRLDGGSLPRGQNNQRALLFYSLLSSLVCFRLSGVVKLNSRELQALLQLWSTIQGNIFPEVKEPARRHGFIQFLYSVGTGSKAV